MKKLLLIFVFLIPSLLGHAQINWFAGAIPNSFAELIKRTQPAVVNISTTQTVKVPSTFDEYFRQHYGVPKSRKQNSLGTGFIIDKEGYIVTNNHVVRGADEIFVNLSDGRTFKAELKGRDLRTDIAIIKISTKEDFPVAVLGDSDQAQVGDWVIAIGNPFGLGSTVTKGIISAKGRHIGAGPYDDFIQTDASINPGNSGGPLFNMNGEVVGVNTAIVESGQGIGFAIPINMVKPMLPQLIKSGKVSRGYLGVSIQEVKPELASVLGLKSGFGAMVSDVVPGSPADVAGIKAGDIVTLYDQMEIKAANELPKKVSLTPIGKEVEIQILRRNERKTFKVLIGDLAKSGEIP